MSDELKCTRCAGRLEAGFLPELGDYNIPTVPTDWVEGEPQPSFWSGLNTDGRRTFKVVTYRCEQCGHLDWFAREPASDI